MARTKVAAVPEVGDEAPEFHLPSAQGGQLRLSVRTARGPVVVVFYSGVDYEEDVEYFKALAGKEDEINMAAASVVGISVGGPDEARDFLKQSGMKSYVLYDYAKVASREWGLLEKDKKLGEYARPAVFIVGTDRDIIHAWTDDRPDAEELLAKISEITGLPKPVEEGEEEEKPKKPKKAAKPDEAAEGATEKPKGEKPKGEKPEGEKPSAEEREKRRAERKAASEPEAGKTDEPEAQALGEEKAPEQEVGAKDSGASEISSEEIPEQGRPEARTGDEKTGEQ
ncbi:MAG: redoxin domain-containing protein [Rubrobacteraceae bacterium]